MTRKTAAKKLNNSGLNIEAHLRTWAMGESIFVGINPNKKEKIITYDKMFYIIKSLNKKTGWIIDLDAKNYKTYKSLDECVYAALVLVKLMLPNF